MKPTTIYVTDKFSIFDNGTVVNPEPNNPASKKVRVPLRADPMDDMDVVRAYITAMSSCDVKIVALEAMSFVLMREAVLAPDAGQLAVLPNTLAQGGINSAYDWVLPADSVCIYCVIGSLELKVKNNVYITPSIRAYTLIRPEGID